MTTTTKMTNVQALTLAVELAKNSGNAELTEKLEKMLATASKPRNASGKKSPSKSQIELENTAREAAAKIAEHGEPVGTVWVMENVKYVTSSQKATAIMRKAMELGLIEKAEPVKGKVQYRAVTK